MSAHPSGLHVRTPDLARSRPPRWAWELRILLGCLNLLIGNEGVGKGVLIAWVLSRLTRGELSGDLHGNPIVVGIIADEDSFDAVWTPRLFAAGADFDHVRHLEREDGWTIDLGEDHERLKLATELEYVRVLFLDALLDNLGAGVDDWRAKPVREALRPLRSLAREHDIAVLGSLHPNKRADTFRQLVPGTTAFNAVSRSSLLLAEHPDEADRRVLVRGKGNLSTVPPAVEFGIESYHFEANGLPFNVPVARDFTIGETTVEELIAASSKPPEQKTAVGDAEEIIRALIPSDGDWHAAKPVYEAAGGEQIIDRTVQRAAQRLGLERRRAREFKAPVEWRWPPQPTPHPTRVGSVATVASVGSVDADKHTHDTHDTHDSENARRECDASANRHLPYTLDLTTPSLPTPAIRCQCDHPHLDDKQECHKCGHHRPLNALTADCEVGA